MRIFRIFNLPAYAESISAVTISQSGYSVMFRLGFSECPDPKCKKRSHFHFLCARNHRVSFHARLLDIPTTEKRARYGARPEGARSPQDPLEDTLPNVLRFVMCGPGRARALRA